MELKNAIICKGNAYSEEEFIEICLELGTRALVGERLGCSPKTLAACLKRYYPDLQRKKPLRSAFLEMQGLAECSCCNEWLALSEFYVRKNIMKGITSECKECTKAKVYEWKENNPDKVLEINRKYKKANPDKVKLWSRLCNAKRRAAKLQRTPSWADLEKIKEVYKNCPEGHHVDHIIPLQGATVSGLHVETNLQYLTAEENLKKGNKFLC